MRRLRTGFKFGVELHADIKIVCGNFYRLYKRSVGRGARYYHARLCELVTEVVIEFVSVTVTFGNGARAVGALHNIAEAKAGICAAP